MSLRVELKATEQALMDAERECAQLEAERDRLRGDTGTDELREAALRLVRRASIEVAPDRAGSHHATGVVRVRLEDVTRLAEAAGCAFRHDCGALR